MKIHITHLYPELLNLYGDRGNIASIVYRCKKRGIECTVTEIGTNDEINFETSDIIFIGGGSEKDQLFVCNSIVKYKEQFKNYVESGGVLLAVCGGNELVGKYYKTQNETVPSLEIVNTYTEYSQNRHIGNIVIKSDLVNGDIVGFENHGGIMYTGDYDTLGNVVSGFGNSGEGKEGIVYKNLIASYLHGPLLPKNPALCDYIILKALENKYDNVHLDELDDTLENNAHDYAVKRFSKQ